MTDTGPAPEGAARLRETLVKEAIAKLSLSSLKAHLSQVTLDSAATEQLVGHVRRANGLVLQRADPVREKRRDAFLEGLTTYLKQRCGDQAALALEGAVRQLLIAEDGYRRILASLQRADITKLPANIRISAVLHRSVKQRRHLEKATTQVIANQRYKMPQSISLRDEHGRPVSPDGVLDAWVSGVGASLVMEGYNSNWLSGDALAIPDLPEVGEEELYQAGSNEVLAQAWRLWKRTEERARFGEGELIVRESSDLPVGSPPEATRCYELRTSSDEAWLNFAAQLRMQDVYDQTFAETYHERDTQERVVSLESGAALPPDAFLNLQEALALGQLSETLGYAVKDDHEQVEGLRILEWLRGFAVLGVLAERHLDENKASLPILTVSELRDVLHLGGLSQQGAATFIDLVTFRRTSRDLFDAPLIEMASGARLLFIPALLGHNPGSILLSVFSNLEIAFPRKGTAFEDRVRDVLRGHGLDARTFKVTRGGDEYEFDVVVPWGDFVFLFECKNRSLPGGHPVQEHHFAHEIRGHARQARRLADALNRWPEILQSEFGRDFSRRTIVPCVLNNLPYARAGDVDGVFFYDWSALTRFFGSGEMNIKTVLTFAKKVKRLHDIPTLRLWSGDRPSPEDLLAQLRDPVQLRIMRHHTRKEVLAFGLDRETIVIAPEFGREDITPRSMAIAAGLDPQKVKLELERAAKRASKSRQREKRRERRGY